MIVDVTALAAVVRRSDMSATVRSFAAVLAPLFVLSSLETVRTFLTSLIGGDLSFSEEWVSVVVTFVIALLAFAPLGFILADWLARRQPLRHLSAITGALIGAIGLAAAGAAAGFGVLFWQEDMDPILASTPATDLVIVATIALVVVLTWLLARARWIRVALFWLGVVGRAFLLVVLGVFIWSSIEDLLVMSDGDLALSDVTGLIAVSGLVVFLIWWANRAVQLRIVLSGDGPRTLLLGDIHRGGFWRRCAFLAGLPSLLWNLPAMRTSAFRMFIVSRPLVYLGLVALSAHAESPLGMAGALGLSLALLAGGHLAFAAGKRLASRSIWRPADRSDEEAPILFLRSFEDDQLDFKRPAWDLPGRWLDLWSFRRNADESLIDEAAQYGPVVALGRPGDARAPFGAMRHYATHEEWQAIVTETAKRAQAIVLVAGETEGLLWEYEVVERERLWDRTVVLFPPMGDGGEKSRQALATFRKITRVPTAIDVPDGCAAVALLRMSGDPTLLVARSQTGAACVVALRAHFQRCTPEDLYDPSYALDDLRHPATA